MKSRGEGVMIYVTGDMHGSIDILKLIDNNFPEGRNLTKDDYVIICGDFGLVWNNSAKERYWLKWLQERSFTTLFIDGNHENFDLLNNYPVEYWNEGKVHIINDSVIHLMRGRVFYIQGKKILTFGGATSIDQAYRTEHISWWKEELPSTKEFEEGLKNLEINELSVDYIITHCCSSETLKLVSKYCNFDRSVEYDSLNMYFDHIEKNINYGEWFFGHYHSDILNVRKNQSLLYKKIVKIV